MPYGAGRRYNRLNKNLQPSVNPTALPTYICDHCKKVKKFSANTVTLNGIVDNAVFLTGRICEDCSKLFKDWMKGK